AVVGVGDEELVRVGWPELAAEGPQSLGREGRARRGAEATVGADAEGIDERRSDARPGEVAAVAPEEDLSWLRAVGQRVGRAAERAQVTPGVELETGVVAATRTRIRHVHEVAVDGDADRCPAVRGDGALVHEV